MSSRRRKKTHLLLRPKWACVVLAVRHLRNHIPLVSPAILKFHSFFFLLLLWWCAWSSPWNFDYRLGNFFFSRYEQQLFNTWAQDGGVFWWHHVVFFAASATPENNKLQLNQLKHKLNFGSLARFSSSVFFSLSSFFFIINFYCSPTRFAIHQQFKRRLHLHDRTHPTGETKKESSIFFKKKFWIEFEFGNFLVGVSFFFFFGRKKLCVYFSGDIWTFIMVLSVPLPEGL